ncbi:hypothetical protein MJO28_006514 [Puccinia striiformis f. sp. tritici]|uniref:Uncharacterized protein n=2 Tax=Puccinia striiformis f. sp. tritici TaxID=168172 RepID=A0A0L0V7L1_9BASI|nr:hypothetical protein Pst134EB_012663 [Puccinia striiformis f. sp. tritici]KAI7953967.1 hypothetical protein MJO28_006514 [Puccinia striiformis f. sp. tritici]KAI7958274.1 hypothetical protein MJO29_006491 [Puccinia striiformis f. sp. tritici]KAI9608385.1 hypothetical protein KEM48_003173 [Puccinia striiformis f. sp. tritici PST-130]KNE95268.1 hypothetical protein PSTG_11440 [Puccinia striiformis f. sp. tritici PST-78]
MSLRVRLTIVVFTMSLRVRLTIVTILVALVGLISADCPKDKPNLWCGSSSGTHANTDCRLLPFYNGCQEVGSGRIGPEIKCCESKVQPSGQYHNVNCRAYAEQCSNYKF